MATSNLMDEGSLERLSGGPVVYSGHECLCPVDAGMRGQADKRRGGGWESTPCEDDTGDILIWLTGEKPNQLCLWDLLFSTLGLLLPGCCLQNNRLLLCACGIDIASDDSVRDAPVRCAPPSGEHSVRSDLQAHSTTPGKRSPVPDWAHIKHWRGPTWRGGSVAMTDGRSSRSPASASVTTPLQRGVCPCSHRAAPLPCVRAISGQPWFSAGALTLTRRICPRIALARAGTPWAAGRHQRVIVLLGRMVSAHC